MHNPVYRTFLAEDATFRGPMDTARTAITLADPARPAMY
jgi:hypothetical protein